jgi:membrane associated rhomboid family serine protease
MGGDQAKYGPILDQIGSVSVLDVVAGRWWRLLTANFVHAGALHIGMNLYFLYAFGPMTERMLGSWRYALFCLAAAIGSTTVGVYFQIALVGFSGIDCGLIGAILAWTMLNRRYLSRQAYAGIMRMVIQNVVLLAIVSLASGVSWSGHLGGAVLGFLASIVLTLNRFGSLPVKIPTLLAALALPALCVVGFKPVAEKTGKWAYWETEFENREVDTFNDELSVPINKDIRDADNAVDHLHINVLLSRLPIGGDVKAAIETLKTQHEILAADEKKLAPVRAYRSERVIEAKAALLERIQTRITLFERQREALEKPSDSDRSEIRELTQRVNSADARWEKVRAGT